jgi:hypothetical protein
VGGRVGDPPNTKQCWSGSLWQKIHAIWRVTVWYYRDFSRKKTAHRCTLATSSHPPWLDLPNYIWRKVQVTKLHIMQFSPCTNKCEGKTNIRHNPNLRQNCQPCYGPRVGSASNRNEYQESSWGVNSGRRVRLTTLPPSVNRLSRPNVRPSTSHNPMGLHGLFQA